MNKKRLTILALLMVTVLVLSLGMFVACNNDTDTATKEEEIIATKDLLIPNGDFKVVSTTSKEYPRNITDWTGSKMYSSGSYESDVVAGAVNLDPVKYNDNKKKWNDTKSDALYKLLTAGDRYASDTIKNALMVYMPKSGTDLGVKDAKYGPTAYGYTSKSFTLDKQSYYKFTVDVLTYDIAGTSDKDSKPTNEADMGARIYLSSNTYGEYTAIDTKGEWKTYTFFIESAANTSTSLNVMLGLGNYSTYFTGGLTTGYAFFDNVELSKLEDIKTGDTVSKTTAEQFQDAKTEEIAQQADGYVPSVPFVKTATLLVPNGQYDFGSTTISSSSAPFNWSVVTGNSNGEDPAPTSIGYNGIIDASKLAENYQKYAGTYYERGGGVIYPSEKLISGGVADILKLRDTTKLLGKNVFMLSQQLMTAQGIKSAKPIVIERGKNYALSLDVYTYNVHGAGVSLILTGTDGKNITIEGVSKYDTARSDATNGSVVSPLLSDGQSNGGWTTYTFYIGGNQFRDYSYNMELWLGTGGTNDNNELKYTKFTSSTSTPTENNAVTYDRNGTFSCGWTFFDELSISTISSDDFVAKKDGQATETDKGFVADNSASGKNYVWVDLESTNMFRTATSATDDSNIPQLDISGDFSAYAKSHENLFDDSTLGVPTGFTTYEDLEDNKRPIIDPSFVDAGVVDISTGEVQNKYFESLGTKHPGVPYVGNTNHYALMMNSTKDGFFEYETIPFSVDANSFYRISVWVKTIDIKSTSGIDFYLMNNAGTADDRKDDTALSSFSKINTKEFDKYTNDWCELTFVVRGDSKKAQNLYLKFTLGSGDRYTTASLAKGAAFVANMSMTPITYKNFTAASAGTYLKTVNMSTTESGSFNNGNFNQFDLEKTKGLDGGLLSKNAGVPLNWSISNNKLADDKNLVAGIVKMDDKDKTKPNGKDFVTSPQIKNVFGADASNFNNLYDTADGADTSTWGGPSMLALAGLNNNKYAIGYTSDSLSLTSQKIYTLSVYVKTLTAVKGLIYLSGETTGVTAFSETPYITIETTGPTDWTKYTFNIEVGLSAVSVKLNMWLGYNKDIVPIVIDETGKTQETIDKEKEEAAKSTGTILFDSVDLKSDSNKEDFDKITEKVDHQRKISFLNEGFDMLSSSLDSRKELTSPSNWTGTEDTEQKKSNSLGGAIFANDSYIEYKNGVPSSAKDGAFIGGGTYVNILGEDIDKTKITIQDEKLNARYLADKDKPEYAGKTEAEVKQILVKVMVDEEVARMQSESWMPMDFLKAHSGESMLIVNNKVDSAYYYSSPSYTLQAEKYYKISVMVRTYFGVDSDGKPIVLDPKKGAFVELYLGSANEVGSPFIFKAVNTTNKDYDAKANTIDEISSWKQLTFYVATRADDVTSVKLKLGLGKYYSKEAELALTKGYAMFDDITIDTVVAKDFEAIVEDKDAGILKREVKNDSTTGKTDVPDEPIVPEKKFDLEMLWWMIPTILLAIVTIIVVAVFAFRKFKKPKKAGAVANVEAITPITEVIEEKRNRYDDNIE